MITFCAFKIFAFVLRCVQAVHCTSTSTSVWLPFQCVHVNFKARNASETKCTHDFETRTQNKYCTLYNERTNEPNNETWKQINVHTAIKTDNFNLNPR